MQYDVKTMTVDAIPLLVIKGHAAQSELQIVVPDLCGEVWSYVRANKVASPGRNVAVYLDRQNGEMDLEVGVEIDPTATGAANVVRSATPAGHVVTTTHSGSYAELRDAHQAIHAWIKANSAKRAGPSWEIYGHWTDEPDKPRTDIFYLLADM